MGWGTFVFSAPTPSFINYQGFLTNSSGVAQSGSAPVTVRIYDASTGGTLLFEELEGSVTITNGFFTVPIGQVGDVNGSTAAVALTDLPFNQAYYVTVELGAPFNTGEMTLAGGVRSQVGVVPFAITSYGALTSATSSGLAASKGKMYFDTTSNQLYVYNGTSWNELGIAGAGITSLNGLSGVSQFFAVGTSGNDVGISSVGATHTINIPNAGSGSRGVVSTTTQTFAGDKTFTGSTVLATTTASTLTVSGQTNLGNASATDVTATNLTSTNAAVTNLINTNATSSNFFASLLSGGVASFTNLSSVNSTSTNGFFSSLLATLANFTNVIIGNSTTTNAIVTNLTVNTSTVGTSTITGNETVGGNLGVTGQTTLGNASTTNLSTGNFTATNINTTATTTTTGLVASIVRGLTAFFTSITGGSFTGGTVTATSSLVSSGLTTLATTTVTSLTSDSFTSTVATLASSTIAKLRLTGELRDSNNATGTAGQVLATNGTSTYWMTITGTVANGTVANQTLYWNGSGWTQMATQQLRVIWL